MALHVDSVLYMYTKVKISNRLSLRVRSWNMHMHAVTPVTLEMLQGMNPECSTRVVVVKIRPGSADVRLEMVLPNGDIAFASDPMTMTETDSLHIGKAEIKYST